MRDSFVFYNSYYEAISELDEKTQLQIFKAVCEYALNGNTPELTGIPKAVFALIKPTIDANEKRYNNGKKGGRPKKTNDSENEKPTVLNSETNGYENEKPNVNDNVNVNVNENANINENVNENISDKSARSSSQIAEIIDLYHKICTSFSRVTTVSENRKNTLKKLMKNFSVGQITEVFETAEKSDFLRGINKNGWKANFDWIIKENNFIKILEGNYNNPQKTGNNDGFDVDKYACVINNFD